MSLTLSRLDILHGAARHLPAFLKRRRDKKIGLKRLVVRSCRVHTAAQELKARELVKVVKWIDVEVMGSDYESDEVNPDDIEEDECVYPWSF